MKLSYAYAAVALLAFGALGCGKKEADDTFATINGEKITTQDYLNFLAEKSTIVVNSSQGPQLASTTQTVGFQGLQDLVTKRLLLQLAKDQGVLPTDAEVSKELDDRNAQQGDYIQTMTQAGLTLEQIKADVMFDLARERLLTKGVVVTPAEVDSYIKENPKAFTEPAKVSLLFVAVGNATKKAQVDKDLAGGASFQTVATRYSEDPQARETGGQFPITDVSQMPQQLQDIVNKTAALKTSAWIPSGPGFVKFYVQSKTPAKPIEMTAAKKDRLRRNMAVQRGQLSTDLSKKQAEKLQASEVTITQPILSKMWTAYIASVKKQASEQAPARTGGVAPSGGPGGAPTTPTTPPATGGTTPPAPKSTDKK